MRDVIQEKLEEIQDIEVTTEIPDDILEENKTYFSFTIQEDFRDADLNKNYTFEFSIIGYIKRIEKTEENTLLIIDNAKEKIKNKLKELNIKTSFQDVSIGDGIRKMRCTGNCLYNEINNLLV